jgi:hypothetical protein
VKAPDASETDRSSVQQKRAMPNLDESRESDRSSDARAASDDYAAQIAALVFASRLAKARTSPSLHERSTSTVLWMSRNTRRTDVTS